MSTEIKNTLFRFISMRAPELNDETKQQERFIFRGEEVVKGAFDTANQNRAKGTTKREALKTTAASFSSATVDEIKELDTRLYEFSVWVAKNRQNYKKEELSNRIEGLRAITDNTVLGLLWDNLFYQTTIQKDFYAKETIIQLLIANHLVANYRVNDDDLAKALLNVKVVLPKALFVEEKEDASQNASRTIVSQKPSYPTGEMAKQQAIAQAELHNQELEILSKELIKVEKAYRKEYNAALADADKEHQASIKPTLDKYASDVEAARKRWCAVKDPSTQYDPNDPCNQPDPVPQPVIPELNFSFRDELDFNYLESKLSSSSFETLLELVSANSNDSNNDTRRIDQTTFVNIVEDFDGFGGLNTEIADVISGNNDVVVDNTTDEDNTSISVGGVIVPITTPVAFIPFSYQLCSKRRKRLPFFTSGQYNSDLSIAVPDATWTIANFDYTVERTDANYTNNGSNTYLQTKVGNTIFLKNIIIGSPLLSDEPKLISFTGTITFTNGVVKTFIIQGFKLTTCSSGVLQNVITDTGDGNDDSTIPVDAEIPFIPSGFGVKQLGIADYNKVEQTTQGYIEGEVAHVENIMAREFKERSTRKLRKKEETFTTSSESEKEQLSDTTSTDRFEMQNEVSKLIADSKDFAIGANVNASYGNPNGPFHLSAGANSNYATHNSKEESTRQAVISSKDFTERALDRIVNKVKEERVEKIVEEFEENNSHGFDNRKGDKHVVGVFRWVDKIFKNQIVNYGKRLMFEFMVPQPAKLHKLGMMENAKNSLLKEPVDPRKATTNKLENFSQLNDSKLKYWAGKYNVEHNPLSDEFISVGKSFSFTTPESNGGEWDEVAAGNEEVNLPEGYNAIGVTGNWYYANEPGFGLAVLAGGKRLTNKGTFYPLSNFKDVLPVSYSALGHHSGSVNLEIKCKRTLEAKKQWQQETFKAIIDAYEEALELYKQRLAEEKASGILIKGANPGFYREFENKILRKNCISYLIDQNTGAKNTYGKSGLFRTNDGSYTETFGNTEVNVGQELDSYSAFVKFMEQAFEWDIMSYNLYPYYWGNRKDWADLYQYDESNDPLFRNFMQAGMARVIITVRPGFEEAVRYYMQTGNIWNGGEVPVIEDELYLSIVDELRQPEGEKLGKAWPTRIPTALTILQAQSIGLNVTKALPFNDDLSCFENPDEVPQSDALELNSAEIGGTITKTATLIGTISGNQEIESKIILKRIDGIIEDITYSNVSGNWELSNLPAGKYELLLDVDDDFLHAGLIVLDGSKEQVIELVDDEIKEISLRVGRDR